jgi:hypothetical protein
MKHHEHYYGWTIEYQANDYGENQFWICHDCPNITYVAPRVIDKVVHELDLNETVEMGLYLCKQIIGDILDAQRLLAFQLVKEFNDSQRPPAPATEPPAFDAEDIEKIPF